MLDVISFPVGALLSNCYLLFDTETRNTIVIDPGDDARLIQEAIAEDGLKPVKIINTHGHGDHIAANEAIKAAYDIPLLIHAGDAPMLTNPDLNLSTFVGAAVLSPVADQELNDGDTISFEDETIHVLHTPGHSPGGITLYVGNFAFTGDALFRGSIGRTDLPGCSHEVLINAIRDKLLPLPDETIVYPGHGHPSTIGHEKETNPFLQ